MDGKIECCTRGFHACESPLELFFYYDIFSSRFAEVELSGTIDRKKATLLCASRIEVKKELTLRDILNAGFEWIKHNASPIVIARFGTYSDRGYDANNIVAVSGKDGDILWCNARFRKVMCGGKSPEGESINAYLSGFDISKVCDSEGLY